MTTQTEEQASPLVLGTGTTLTEAAYLVLRKDIISGRRAPDERLRIERLRRLYEVGPTPLREALQRLAADGLVIATGNRGFTVAPLEAEEFQDLNRARTVIECEALKLSILHGDATWESNVVAAAYRQAKLDASLNGDTEIRLSDWEAANQDFHLATVAACGSKWLLHVRQLLHDQCERYRRASVGLRRANRDLESEHREIAEAVIARDADRACTLVSAHFHRTTEILLEEMQDEDTPLARAVG